MSSNREWMIEARRARVPVSRIARDMEAYGQGNGRKALLMLLATVVPLCALSVVALTFLLGQPSQSTEVPDAQVAAADRRQTEPAPALAKPPTIKTSAPASVEPPAPIEGAAVESAVVDRQPAKPETAAADLTADPVKTPVETASLKMAGKPAPAVSGTPVTAAQSEAAAEPSCRDRVETEAVATLLLFERGEARLNATQSKSLARFSKAARSCAVARIELAGFADDEGDPAGDAALSLQRANTVRKALIRLGVPQEQLIPVAYGNARPTGDAKQSLPSNRRVQIVMR